MKTWQIYLIGVGLSTVVLISILAAPVIGLPFGVVGSTGDSMGDDGIILNVWVDTEPEIGDVVLLDVRDSGMEGNIAAHRVQDRTDKGYTTKGDSNTFVDQDVSGVEHGTDETIVGTVVYRISVRDTLAIATLVSTLGIAIGHRDKK